MASKDLDVSDLTPSEKLALMERLWESLSGKEELAEPPDWHAEVLRSREEEWRQRDGLSQDWGEAKKEIRNKAK
jgi:hypothetical protein